jgi:hypothetical protein
VLLSTAWEAPDGSRAQILVNPTDAPQMATVAGKTMTVAPLQAMLLPR